MRAILAVMAAAAALAPASAQIDPVACTTNAALEFTFDLGLAAGCYKGTVDHQDSSSNSNTVKATVEFPTPTVTNPVSVGVEDVVYGIYVFDPTQGSDTAFEWAFDTSPEYTPLGGSATTLSSISLQKRASTGFVNSRDNYLRARHLTNPVGRYTISFETDNARTTKLRYVIAVKKLSAEAGHLAESSSKPIDFEFGKAGTAKYVSLGTWTSSTRNVYSRASGYRPGDDGRLVQDLKVHATIDTGADVTSARATSSLASSDSDFEDVTGSVAKAEFGLPPAVYPRRRSSPGASTIPGQLTVRWTIRLYDTSGTTRGVDLTASPGPFLLLNPGSTDDAFTEAERIKPGATVTTAFDSERKSTDDSRATLSHKLIRVDLPALWWSARFELKGSPTDGPDSGATVELSQYVKEVLYAPQRSVTATSKPSSFSGILAEPGNPGFRYFMNDGMGLVSGIDPVGGASTGSIGTYPHFDSRMQSTSAYILLCREASCGTASSTTLPTKVTATAKFHSAGTFGGECRSAPDCAQPEGGEHPAQNRVALSANGDASRFDKCILFVDGSGTRPETRCVECMSDCECSAGQYCRVWPGVQRFGSHLRVIHEDSRLRAGTCVRRDLNGTQLGKKCRRLNTNANPFLYNPSSTQSLTFSATNQPYLQDQKGAVPCGEWVWTNATYQTGSPAYTNNDRQALAALWRGHCDNEGICQECRPSTSTNLVTQCSSQQVCLDGRWWRGYSMDYTVRTLNNNTIAGGALASALALFFIAFLAAWMCICTNCCGGEGRKGFCGCCSGGKGKATRERNPVETEAVAVKP